jgi:hypothetical protein
MSIHIRRISMTSPIVTWLLTLISGAVGGNIGGALIEDQPSARS